MKNNMDFKMIIAIIIFGFLVFIPYIESFDNYDCRVYSSGDSWFYMSIVNSIANDHDLDMSNNIEARYHVSSSQLSLSKNDCLTPKHGIFFPLATVPFYLVLGKSSFVFINLILSVLILVLIYLLVREFFNEQVSFLTTILFSVSTIILNYSYNYSSDVFSTVIILSGILLVIKKNYYLAAIFLGLSVFAKITNGVWVLLILFYMAIKIYIEKDKKIGLTLIELLKIGLILLISLMPTFITNYSLYGDIFTTGYHRIVKYTMDGNLILLSHKNDFNRPFFNGLYSLFFHHKFGILLSNLVLLPALAGIFFINRMKKKGAAILFVTIILAQTIFFSIYRLSTATEFGNRFLFLSIILSAVFVANIIDLIISRYFTKLQID